MGVWSLSHESPRKLCVARETRGDMRPPNHRPRFGSGGGFVGREEGLYLGGLSRALRERRLQEGSTAG